MKKVILFVLISIALNTVSAQISGDFIFGGVFSYTKSSQEGVSYNPSRLSINTIMGTMVSDEVAIGVSMGYQSRPSSNQKWQYRIEVFKFNAISNVPY